MTGRSALYVGTVVHRRLRPRVHDLRYRVFWMLIDLDELSVLGKRLRVFSHNRFNVVSFHDRDHGEGSARVLRPQVEAHLAAAGIDLDGGPIRLLCMPRILGYVFNPLSIYFCYRRAGGLAAILYEVNNTFGERHSYLIPAAAGPGPIDQRCEKSFYVSPFMGMEMTYRFRVVPPGSRVSVSIRGETEHGPLIVATLAGQRRPLNTAGLARALVTHPLLTLKVIAAIHWHALCLWRKGARVAPKPSPPAWPVTVVDSNG